MTLQLGLTPQQIEEKRWGIYGTDAKRIVEGDWRQLWREKKGIAQPEDLSDIIRVQLGSFTEPFNCFWFERRTGRTVRERNVRWFAPENNKTLPEWMAANLDGVTRTAAGKPAYIDFKHVGQASEATVIRYTPQLTHCALVCNVDWWIISFLIGNSRWEMIEQEVDPFFAEDLLRMEREFWGYIERNEEPPEMAAPIEAPKPQPVLRKIALNDDNQSEWPNWGAEAAELISDFIATEAGAKKHAIVRKHITALLPEDVGEVTRGTFKLSRDKAGAIRMATRKKK